MAIAKLFQLALGKGMKLGLERMQRLDELFDFPSRSFLSIHVGGTNGKGSTSCKIASALQFAARKVGLYTSPHISTVRERIQLNGSFIPLEEMSLLLEDIFTKSAKESLQPTFFEVMTLLSFLYFRKMQVDVAVIEVGLGGRLDATNIITPLLSIITSIGYDHMPYLGNSLEQIALEKGGIIKEGIPVLLGPIAAHQKLLHRMAAMRNSPCHLVTDSYFDYEDENRAIAKKALDVLPFKTYAEEGLMQTPSCRFEHFKKDNCDIILDVAHNGPAIKALCSRLKRSFEKVNPAFVVGFSADKDVEAMLDILILKASCIYLVKASHLRAYCPKMCADYLTAKGFKHFIVEDEIGGAFKLAIRDHSFVVVTGTFYIMKEIRAELGFNQEVDNFTFPY